MVRKSQIRKLPDLRKVRKKIEVLKLLICDTQNLFAGHPLLVIFKQASKINSQMEISILLKSEQKFGSIVLSVKSFYEPIIATIFLRNHSMGLGR